MTIQPKAIALWETHLLVRIGLTYEETAILSPVSVADEGSAILSPVIFTEVEKNLTQGRPD
jgi:hypothetical protein